jgi:type IV secretion system protein VirB8
MFKRKQQDVSDGSKHWYQDKYQHVLTQRNLLALIALLALLAAIASVMAVMVMAPLKTVEPYLIQIDDATGVTQRVKPVTRADYVATEAVDRYFVSTFLRAYEGYNPSIVGHNQEVVRLLSKPQIFFKFRQAMNPNTEGSLAKRMGPEGIREIRIRSLAYIQNPPKKGETAAVTTDRIIQANLLITEDAPSQGTVTEPWVATITFEYANLPLDKDEQLINPLNFLVTGYQIQREGGQ